MDNANGAILNVIQLFSNYVFSFILHDKFYMPKKFKDQMYIGTICMSPSMVYLLIYE